MRRPLLLALVAALLAALTLPAAATLPTALPAALGVGDHPLPPTVRAGVGVVDATWNVGAAAGQYSAENTSLVENLAGGGEVDPHQHSRIKEKSYGTHSRLTVRAVVVEGLDGRRIALLKSDNYLAQDLLLRRVGQLLDDAGSDVAYADILHHASHNHSSPYYTTTSPGVFVFQDVFDQRMFEYQARAIRDAILEAEADLRPARMAAHTVNFDAMKDNVVGPATADDGSPAGYPRDFGDEGLVVMRFDELVPAGKSGQYRPGEPIAVWMNFGEHPESLDGYGLTTSDFLGPLERFVEREVGAPLLFSQGDVGSAEGPYERETPETLPDGTLKAFAHTGYAQMERGARLMADAVIEGFHAAATKKAQVPWSSDLAVDALTAWVPGPLSHPVPTVGNCRSEPTYSGNPGVGVAPDCERAGTPTSENPVVNNLRMHGVPVPQHYGNPGYPAVEENTRLKLQVFRLGEVLLASCACEAQVDLILNLESRMNQKQQDMWLGYDWSTHCEPATDGGYLCDGKQVSSEAYERMRAQVFNDAAGWDAPEYAAYANSEPTDPTQIKGNFTHEELPAELGYALPVGVGHAGDYNGYTVSYREYMSRDHYRKALTSHGPHTADYMATRLMRMAGALKGGPPLAPELHDAAAQADELRQEALARAIGAISGPAYDAWLAALPADVGPNVILEQPTAIERFDAARVTWRGGSNAVDNPDVRVERLVDDEWQRFADMSGEVQTMLHFPLGVQGVADTYTGRQEWLWTASFEAFTGFPARFGSTPPGTYRFVIDGASRVSGSTAPYSLASDPFEVTPASSITGAEGATASGFRLVYPRSYDSPFRTIADDGGSPICRTCSFRPWASEMRDGTVLVTVARAGGGVERVAAQFDGERWSVPGLAPGDHAVIVPGDARDTAGNTNGTPIPLT